MSLAAGTSDGRRVVMFVRNPCTNDIRVLREAATLQAAGYPTTIVALQPGGSDAPPDQEDRDGLRIIRVPAPAGWRVRWRDMRYYPWRVLRGVPRLLVRALRSGPSGIGDALGIAVVSVVTLPYTVIQAVRYVTSRRARPRPHDVEDGLDHLAWWWFSVRGWAAAAATAAPPADVYHGHDLTALPAALGAGTRAEAAVVYDSHELFVEAAEEARQPWWVKRVIAMYEQRLIRRVDAIVTVNDGIAQELHRRYGGPSAVVVHNAPPRQAPREPRPDHLRHAAGIPTGAPVVLYHGGFQTGRGLEILAEAFQEPVLHRAHLVYLGYGSAQPTLEKLASDPRFGGRIHVLPRVPPDDLLDWVASADLAAMIIQPTTLNHRLSSPNKLFEAMAAGVPVVASDLPVMAAIVRATGCGLVVDPTDRRAIAAACAEILDAPPDATAEWRRRALAAADQHYNWERESVGLLDLYGRLAAR